MLCVKRPCGIFDSAVEEEEQEEEEEEEGCQANMAYKLEAPEQKQDLYEDAGFTLIGHFHYPKLDLYGNLAGLWVSRRGWFRVSEHRGRIGRGGSRSAATSARSGDARRTSISER